MPPPVITLSTDFGDGGAYVAMLKGVLLRLIPDARLVDLSHRLPADHVFATAWLLRRVYHYYPAGTIHLVGTDGVGGRRRALAAGAAGQFFLARDNGALGLVLAQAPGAVHGIELATPTTFLARDVLAPLAARLARGEPPSALGPVVDHWQRLELAQPEKRADGVHGQVLHVDCFGNLVTNLTPADVPSGMGRLEVGGLQIDSWRQHYDEAAPGEIFLLWGAEGWLEVSVAQASAAQRLETRKGTGIGVGTKVVMR